MKGLEVPREHHLAAARAHADDVLQQAREVAQSILDKARSEAQQVTRQAEEEGQASADQDTEREWTAAHRRARAIRLAAQRAVYEDVKAAAVRTVRADWREPDLLALVGDAARARLGPGVAIVLSADAMNATRKAMHVRWTVEDAVEESLRRLGRDVEQLWR